MHHANFSPSDPRSVFAGLIVALVVVSARPAETLAQCSSTELDIFTISDTVTGGLIPGNDIAMSADGSTAVIPDEEDDEVALNAGAVYILVRNGNAWLQQVKLTAPDVALGDRFGITVALSADGDSLLIGSYLDDDLGENSGSVYFYTRSGTTWTMQQKFNAPDGAAGDQFGNYIAMSAAGDLAAIASFRDDHVAEEAGSVYIYERTGSTWSMQTKIVSPAPAEDDEFGTAIDLSAAGDVLLVGSPLEDGGPQIGFGAAHIYRRNGSMWTHDARLSAAGGLLGQSVSLSADGSMAFIGAPGEQLGPLEFGAVYLFGTDGVSWTQQARFEEPEAFIESPFGLSVDLNADGTIAVAGANRLGGGPGLVRLYTRTGSNWQLRHTILPEDPGPLRSFGGRVAINPDADILIVLGSFEILDITAFFLELEGCDPLVPGDVNGDGVVDVSDLLAVLAAWGPCAGCPEDVNADGIVDVLDLLILLSNWS